MYFRLRCPLLVSILAAASSLSASPLGPSPYVAYTDSPFRSTSFTYFYLEDFEDGSLNTPGVSVNAGVLLAPAFRTDSVDADDGTIDGSGQAGRSLYTNFTTNNLVFTFSAAALGVLPTHAGIVWTDVGGDTGTGLVEFEPFDNLGVSLGITSATLGDGFVTGQTPEDRFFGFINPTGISRIEIRMPDSRDWEVDHLQYGSTASVPEPAAFSLAGLAMAGLFVVRRART